MTYVVGFGAVTAILWEIAEYFVVVRFSEELATAYGDTLGDMTLGLIGSVVAGLIAALFFPPPAGIADTPQVSLCGPKRP